MDKDLDDLLDSALDDFDKKTPIVNSSLTATQEKINTGNVTIEKTNLYVDDIDYDDRPARAATNLSSNFLTSKVFNSTNRSNSNQPNSSQKDAFSMSSDDMKLFEEIFSDEQTKQSMKQFSEAFNMFKTGGDEKKLLENFEKVMSELNLDNSGDEDDEENLNEKDLNFLKNLTTAATSTSAASKVSDATPNDSTTPKAPMNKVLDDLNKNSENLFKNLSDGFPFGGSEFLSSLMNGNDEGEEEGLDSASALMMEPILSMLFSKDILYPSLKMMLENFDKYIEENKEKLKEEEFKKLNDQQECIKEMCSIYESQKEDDSKELKSQQLKRILDLLEKCGVSNKYPNTILANKPRKKIL
jgi:hypothetical protein